MTTRTVSIAGTALIGLITAALAIKDQLPAKEPTRVVQPREHRGRIAIGDFAVTRDGTVSGTLCNVSNEPVRDVRLVIERTWVWKKEFRGTDHPGRSELHTVEETIPPGGQLPFTYRPSARLPNGIDGHYDTSVGVVSLVAIGPGTARARKGGWRPRARSPGTCEQEPQPEPHRAWPRRSGRARESHHRGALHGSRDNVTAVTDPRAYEAPHALTTRGRRGSSAARR